MKTFIQKLMTHEGRRNRVEWLQGYLFILVGYLIIFGVINSLKDIIPQIQILLFLAVPLAISFWFINIQRLHDCGQSGYLMLCGLIPGIGILVYLYLWFMPGNSYPNKYDFVKDGGMSKDQ